MSKTDRLLAIVLELQRKGWQRAEDLAATFERSPRTIYQDILALSGDSTLGARGTLLEDKTDFIFVNQKA
jgi:DeoR/GlpR family transcriptional regulator of sugar metabolism